MSFPKGFRKNVKTVKQKIGVEQREQLLEDVNNQGTFLPRGVDIEDIDKTFIDFIDGDLTITVDGEKVPVIFLSIQRWAEFSKTWSHADGNENIKIPFITVVRNPDIQQGTNQSGSWNIPGRPMYTYMKVPTFDGVREGVDVYKIPQPTSIDVTYDVRFFCNKMRDLNKLHKSVQQLFRARQHYIKVNGHPMPIHLENVSDESQIDDLESRRFYVQVFEMKLLGYILDEEEFEVIPTVNRIFSMNEVVNKLPEIKPNTNK
jgi:hypothetical protein